MTLDNFETFVNQFLSNRPFQVFVVELHGGIRYEVDHPTALSYRDGRAAFLLPGGGPVVFDHDSVNQMYLGTASDLAAATANP